MKEVKAFKCDTCKEVYVRKIDCENCEKKHSETLSIINTVYDSGNEYPLLIAVSNDTGSGAVYKRKWDDSIEGIYEYIDQKASEIEEKGGED